MKKVKFCRINLDYIKYLHSFDIKVQYNVDASDAYNFRRPYIGIVLKINGFNYFAPLESPKDAHKTMKNNTYLLKINKGFNGLIAFNNMIPVKDSEIVNFNFKDEDEYYKNLLTKQFAFCNANKELIQTKAEKTYAKVVDKKDPFTCENSCNFKLLEEKSLIYK